MMQKYLAWDTSSATGIVVAFEVVDNKFRLVSEWSLSFETGKHSERLLWTIDVVLKSAGWKLSELTAIGVGVGPGSFTGLRIGITTAKILATQLNISVIPVSSLSMLARGAISLLEVDPAQNQTLVIACTDATKGEWFTFMGPLQSAKNCISMPEGDAPGIWGDGVTEKTMVPDEVIECAGEYLKKNEGAEWIALGQSIERYPELWKSLPLNRKARISSLALDQLQPRMLATLVWESVQQGLKREANALKPRYLRASEAEVKLAKGELKVQPVTRRG